MDKLLELMDRYLLDVPYEALLFVAEMVRRFLNMKEDEPIRAGVGNMALT